MKIRTTVASVALVTIGFAAGSDGMATAASHHPRCYQVRTEIQPGIYTAWSGIIRRGPQDGFPNCRRITRH